MAGAIYKGLYEDPLNPRAQQQLCDNGKLMTDLWQMLCAGADVAGVELKSIQTMDFTGGGSGDGGGGKKGKVRHGRK